MQTRDLVLIGSGPAGLTAALYAARADLKPLLLGGFIAGGPSGGQLTTTTEVENFPGFPEGIQGPELVERMRRQAVRFGAEVRDQDVTKVDFSSRPFRLWTEEGEIQTRAVIVATGASAKLLGIEAEKRFWNRGISACATCDGALPLFRGKPLVVIGGGDTAMEEATFLTRFASSVTLVHRRDGFRASDIMLNRVRSHPKIVVKTPYVLEDTAGGKTLESVKLKNVATGAVEELTAAGLFMAIGHEPNTAVFKGQLALNNTGYVRTFDGLVRASVAGVFAAGDCADPRYRQAVTAAGTGCMAALEAQHWLEEQS
jgi:thioredoxin reductase (NADPH)